MGSWRSVRFAVGLLTGVDIAAMDELFAWTTRGPSLPESPTCATCGIDIAEPYGWCAGCRAAFCFPCGRKHFCTPSCEANGCIAGLCVRKVDGGVLSEQWGLPDELAP